MKLLFIEPEKVFFNWLEFALRGHECVRAATIDEAEDRLSDGKFDAVFLDVSGHIESPAVVVAKARTVANSAPLIILTGREVRADLAKICDGFIFKCDLKHPEKEIPSAVAAVSIRRNKMQPMDKTTQLVNALTALRIA